MRHTPAAPAPRTSAAEPMDVVTFDVTGMDCASCAHTLEKVVAGLPGVFAARVSFGSSTLVVEGDPAAGEVAKAASRAGFAAQRSDAVPQARTWLDQRAASMLLSVALLLAGGVVSMTGVAEHWSTGLYLTSIAGGGWPVARSAATALRARSFDMNVLMTAASLGAVAIGHVGEGAWVLALYAIGTTLESAVLDRGRRALENWAHLVPPRARLLQGTTQTVVPLEQVRVGDRLLVMPGEIVPLDGVVRTGRSRIDVSAVTGESELEELRPGDRVLAGTLNTEHELMVTVTAPVGDSALDSLAELVSEARDSRTPSERFVDRFARVYTPVVLTAALLTAIVPVLFGGDLHTWAYRALALLLMACPCALVISVPVTVAAAISGAARSGVLIKSGRALEQLGRATAVAIDKTGTLTQGRHDIATIITTADISEDEAVFLLATIEQSSSHPLAAAVAREAELRELPLGLTDQFEVLPGRGVRGTIGTRRLWAGGPRLVADLGATMPDAVALMERRGETAIALGQGEELLAVFGFVDEVRSDAPATIAQLQQRGLEPLVLSGDCEPVTAAVAEELGLEQWKSGLLPKDKLEYVWRAADESGTTVMVGDGANDAPSMAGATVGIAVGSASAELTTGPADVVLMGDDLRRVPESIAHGRRARHVMWQNITFALLAKAAFAILAPLGLVTIVDGIVADMAVSLVVTLNGLRLLRMRHEATQ